MEKVFVLMSGGVDSSVSALLLKRAGFDVVGIHLRMTSLNNCAWNDWYDAKKVAEILDIPFYTYDIEKDYEELIMKKTLQDYQKGITPNPDVWCNSKIKFGLFVEKFKNQGFIASGHYAKKINNLIAIPKDKNKDQTYFLWQIRKEILPQIIFPLGNLLKSEVRQIAKENGLPVALKKDSQGLCFVGKIRFIDFLKSKIPPQIGNVVDPNGRVIGYHYGHFYYTLGQRHGFWAPNGPWYIVDKDPEKNIIKVAKIDNELAWKQEIFFEQENFFIDLKERMKVNFRVRYRQNLEEGILFPFERRVVAETKIKVPTPGQSIVFYQNDILIGGGVISQAF